MTISNKPLVWGPFAAGGTITAFVTPVLILLTLFAALGHIPELLAYDNLHHMFSHRWVKLVTLALIFLSLWSAAHRLRVTLYDFGVRADTVVAALLYIATIAASVAAAVYLVNI
jgi:fumarate reductase subunit D